MEVSTGTNMPTLHFVVNEDQCYGCGACIGLCPTNALSMEGLLAVVDSIFLFAMLILFQRKIILQWKYRGVTMKLISSHIFRHIFSLRINFSH